MTSHFAKIFPIHDDFKRADFKHRFNTAIWCFVLLHVPNNLNKNKILFEDPSIIDVKSNCPVLLSPLSPTRNLPQDQVIFAVIFMADYNEFERLSLSHGKAQGIYRNDTAFELKSRYQLFGVPCGYVYFVHN